MLEYRWLVYALLSAVTAAFVAIFGKVGLRGVDANSATAVRAVIMAAFLVGVVAAQGRWESVREVLVNRRALLFVCLSGVAGALSWLFYFPALRHGKVAQVAPIDKLSVVFATLFAIAFLGERISFTGGAGIALIALGALLVALG